MAVVKDAKYPHAKYKCEMCECYFNDEFAKVLHCKGRRHRLNYKVCKLIRFMDHLLAIQKSYQPDLKVEPTKQMRHQMEKRRRKEQERRKSFKGERMQHDKMSRVSIILMLPTCVLLCLYSHPPAFIRVILVTTREGGEVGLVQ